jgi:uncharacterized protein DUF4255
VATYRAIAATSETLRTLLESACPRDEFPDARFELFQAADFPQKKLAEGISLFLYRVAVNTTRRNLTPTVRLDGRRVKPPIPVDLYYLCSAWGKAVSRQHALLGWCMRTLEDANVLPASVLNNPGPFDDTFRPNEGVELVCEPLSLADLNNLWEVLRPDIPVSVGYVVRAVPLESTLPLAEYDPVQTRELRFEQ